jgi:hypothetical protein
MADARSNARARAASPSAPAFNPSPAAAQILLQKHQWQLPEANDESLVWFPKIDVIRGFPYDIGVFIGQLFGLPASLLGLVAYICTAPPRNVLCLTKYLVMLLARALLNAALIAALLAVMYAVMAGSSGFNLPKPGVEYLNPKSYSNLPVENTLLLTFSLLFFAQYFFAVFRPLFNVFLLALLASQLHPSLFAFAFHRYTSFATAAAASAVGAANLAVECLPALAAALLALFVLSYIANIILTLLCYFLWLLLLLPRFAAGFMVGVSTSFTYLLCALTLTYHPDHSW